MQTATPSLPRRSVTRSEGPWQPPVTIGEQTHLLNPTSLSLSRHSLSCSDRQNSTDLRRWALYRYIGRNTIRCSAIAGEVEGQSSVIARLRRSPPRRWALIGAPRHRRMHTHTHTSISVSDTKPDVESDPGSPRYCSQRLASRWRDMPVLRKSELIV